jgi:GNAT superfamily N-acetyltransferase
MLLSKEDEKDKLRLRKLWKDVFKDPDDYLDVFFGKNYRHENAVFIKQKSRIVSAGHIVPYEVKAGPYRWMGAYICGVCTLPSKRGKGLMRQLMKMLLDTAKERGYQIAFLIPQENTLFPLYQRLGFNVVLSHCVQTVNRERFKATGLTFKRTRPDDYHFFDVMQFRLKNIVLQSQSDFNRIIKDFYKNKGRVLTAREGNAIRAIAFMTIMPDNTLIIKDIYFNSTKIAQTLIQHALRHTRTTSATVHTPIKSPLSNGTYAPYALAHLLNRVSPTTIQSLHVSLMYE